MTLSNELFFGLFSLLIVVTVVWFIRSAANYKKWVKHHYAEPKSQLSEKRREALVPCIIRLGLDSSLCDRVAGNLENRPTHDVCG